MALGEVGILSVGAGDIKISFNPANPAERLRAARVVKDMLQRGYALIVEIERDGKKAYERALGFREDTCEYIIADLDSSYAESDNGDYDIPPEAEAVPGVEYPVLERGTEGPSKKKGRPRKTKAVSATEVNSKAIARSAGG